MASAAHLAASIRPRRKARSPVTASVPPSLSAAFRDNRHRHAMGEAAARCAASRGRRQPPPRGCCQS
eukprot:4308115-Prymnesium_polylepis.1